MLFLIQKEFKQFFRNKFLPKLMFAFPIVAILVMPWVANMEIKNVNLSVIDFDNSQISSELIDKISHSSFFNITHFSKNKADSMNCIYENLCDIILEIPSDFSQNLRRENTANIGIMANSINSSKGVLGSGYLANIVNDFSPKITLLNQNTSKLITSQFLFNPALDYKIYMILALSVMILTMICGFLPAFNIIGEKQKGNLE